MHTTPPAVEAMIRAIVAKYARRNIVVRAHQDDVLQEARLAAWVASAEVVAKVETWSARRGAVVGGGS